MSKIVPHLWFDKEAKEAAEFYITLFENSKILNTFVLGETPSGDSEIVNFQLAGQTFASISAGPYFKFNPSISLMVHCESPEEVASKWEKLIQGGTALMELGEYPFSKRYGWLQDRYGLSWQLMYAEGPAPAQKIVPNFLFSNEVCGRAEEAIKYYTEIFPESKTGLISKYQEGEAHSPKAKVNYAAFSLLGYEMTAMDNAYDTDFNFNEAFSIIVNCADQSEIDYYWEKLSAVPEAEQCGWLKDQFGVSWQIVPENMDEVFLKGTEEEARRVTEAFLKMKKFDLAELERARLGKPSATP